MREPREGPMGAREAAGGGAGTRDIGFRLAQRKLYLCWVSSLRSPCWQERGTIVALDCHIASLRSPGVRVVALSEHEQRAIERLEEVFRQEAQGLVRKRRSLNSTLLIRRRLVSAVLGVVMGLVLLLAFCLTTSVAMGVVGFLIMFASLDGFWSDVRLIGNTRVADDDGRSKESSETNDARFRSRFFHWLIHGCCRHASAQDSPVNGGGQATKASGSKAAEPDLTQPEA